MNIPAIPVPEAPGDAVPAASRSGTAGESPGPGETLAAASAFLPVLMQVLNAPLAQAAFPDPNREESATVQTGNITGAMPSPATALAEDMSAILPHRLQSPEESPVPLQVRSQSSELPARHAAPVREDGPPRIQLLRSDGWIPVESPAGPADVSPREGGDVPLVRFLRTRLEAPEPGRDPAVPTGEHPQAPSDAPRAVRADVPRLMDELVAARTPFAARCSAPRTAPDQAVPPAPEPVPGDLQRVESPVSMKPAAPPAADSRIPVMVRETLPRALDDGTRTTASGPERDLQPAAPARQLKAETPVPQAPADAGRREQRTPSRQEGENPVRQEPARVGAAGNAFRSLFPMVQQPGSVERGGIVPSLRTSGVQGLPRELVNSVLQRVVREMVITGARGGTEARIALKPDSLGQVLVHISMDDNVMSAKIEVAQPAAKAVFDAGMPQLRDALTARGIAVQQLDVFTSADAMSRNSSSREQRDGKSRGGGQPRRETPAVEETLLPRMLGYNTIELSM